MSRPRPVPWPTGLVVKNGSKMRSRISAGMPGPLSAMRTTTLLVLAAGHDLDAARSGTASSALSIRFAQIWFSSPANPRTRGRSGSTSTDTATDLLRAFDFSTATVLSRPCARSTGSATVAWSMCVKPLTARTSPAIRVAASWISEARRRTEHPAAAQRSAALSAGPRRRRRADRAPRTSRRFRRAPRRRPCRGRGRRASRRWLPRVRRARSATARPARAPPRRRCARRRSRRTGRRSAGPRRARAPPARRPRAGSSRSAALRSIADAGLFSSWARPADSLPSEIIFSSCSSLDVKSRARSSIAWTRIDVSSGHSRIIARRWSRGTTRTSDGSWAIDIARRGDQAGVRQQARHVAAPPFHELVRAGAAVDEDRDAAREHDEQPSTGAPFADEHVARLQLPKGSRARPATRAPRAARRRGSCASPADRRDRSHRHERFAR